MQIVGPYHNVVLQHSRVCCGSSLSSQYLYKYVVHLISKMLSFLVNHLRAPPFSTNGYDAKPYCITTTPCSMKRFYAIEMYKYLESSNSRTHLYIKKKNDHERPQNKTTHNNHILLFTFSFFLLYFSSFLTFTNFNIGGSLILIWAYFYIGKWNCQA